jgi:hypothetical protein
VGFLRRLLGASGTDKADRADGADEADGPDGPDDEADGELQPAAADLDSEERARELELARFDQDRVDDLIRRQQRYANRSWTPPAEGGQQRADDGDIADS